jgi:tRNA uridine 5-carboxymethylaminomethyl modification enzyme
MKSNYDIIVVGAGHAGCESAFAAARLGSSVLLITMNMETIAKMSCNPAVGGVAKGQIVREIDALGGMTGIITDKSTIQFRMLNRSKGPAMWSPRAQCDRMEFSWNWRLALESNQNIDFWQDNVSEILSSGNKIDGVKTSLGIKFYCRALIITSGTFLNGLIHIGKKNFGGGRASESASYGITKSLNLLGFESGRMKTGTPPRIDGRSLDYSKMEEQTGDEDASKFSYWGQSTITKQKSCFITYTNPRTHDILREGFADSPMFNGSIQGIGPRYCPSIEDKINRFAERERHQIFVEPEGRDTVEIYVNGFSTSLSEEIQYRALQEIPGFENAKMFRPGYAIEYDYFPPTQLKASLETKLINNLFFAGQINGTTGYEEAACQGLIAGINAHQKINENAQLVLSRNEAYIGVLIDDLINKGTDEPYRMFTSRAEYRILLRQDNADQRLSKIGYHLGLLDNWKYDKYLTKIKNINSIITQTKTIKPSLEEINPILKALDSSLILEKVSLHKLLLRTNTSFNNLTNNWFEYSKPFHSFSEEEKEEAEIMIKYAGYMEKEREMANKINSLEHISIKDDFNFNNVKSLSAEAREKLTKIKPSNIGQASRISGVSPADISILLVHFGR